MVVVMVVKTVCAEMSILVLAMLEGALNLRVSFYMLVLT
jgi:hypothetical protein